MALLHENYESLSTGDWASHTICGAVKKYFTLLQVINCIDNIYGFILKIIVLHNVLNSWSQGNISAHSLPPAPFNIIASPYSTVTR